MLFSETGPSQYTFVCKRNTANEEEAIQLTKRFSNVGLRENVKNKKQDAIITRGFMYV